MKNVKSQVYSEMLNESDKQLWLSVQEGIYHQLWDFLWDHIHDSIWGEMVFHINYKINFERYMLEQKGAR